MAEALAQIGQVEEGVTLIDAVLAGFNPESGNNAVDIADLLRCRAELELARAAPDRTFAEATLLRSLALANAQAAAAWELRSALALARFRLDQGHRDEARTLLSRVSSAFSGTMHTCDSPIAADLLAELDGLRG